MSRKSKRDKNGETRGSSYISKTREIKEACQKHDLSALRKLAKSPKGFLNDNLRRLAWPLLLNCVDSSGLETENMAHKDENQVALDVVRSFNVYPQSISIKKREAYRSQLSSVIKHVLRSFPEMHYYQGFHDICSVFTIVCNDKVLAGRLMENVSLFLIRDAMLESMEPILKQLTMVDTILKLKDPALHAHLSNASIPPYYCLSWVITWFSHDLNDLSKITRLFDLFLSTNPLMPVYVSAALVLSRRNYILHRPCDFSELHTFLTRIPQNIDAEALVAKAIELENDYPPRKLQSLSGIALDKQSAVNTYESLWSSVRIDSTHSSENIISESKENDGGPPKNYHQLLLARQEARKILAMPPEERTPIDISSAEYSEQFGRSQQILSSMRQIYSVATRPPNLLGFAVLVGVMAILLSNASSTSTWMNGAVAYMNTLMKR